LYNMDVNTNADNASVSTPLCPLCGIMPSRMFIACCSLGIICHECVETAFQEKEIPEEVEKAAKDKMKRSYIAGIRCTVCGTIPGDPGNYFIHWCGALISCLSDISCPGKSRGCSFQGTLEEVAAHSCRKGKLVSCFVCNQQVARNDFSDHNSKNCFQKNLGHSFSVPSNRSLYLVQEESEEVLVEVGVLLSGLVKKVGLSFYGKNLSMMYKMKILVNNPNNTNNKLEVVTEVTKKMHHYNDQEDKNIIDHDIILSVEEEEQNTLKFEILEVRNNIPIFYD